jgi:hypothetical protein
MEPQNNQWINEERIHNLKTTMVYMAYLETLYPGFIDKYSDQIVDALIDYWKTDEKLDWIHAQTVVAKWLKPLLDSHFNYFVRSLPKSDSLCVCPKCGHKFKF